MIGFHRFLGQCSVARAEAWGIVEGLRLAPALGLDSIEVECDSSYVVGAIIGDLPMSFNLSPLVSMAHVLLSSFHRWKLNHRWREANH